VKNSIGFESHIHWTHVNTDRVSGEGNAIGRVRLFPLCPLNEATSDLDFCIHVVGHDHNSPGITAKSRSQVKVRVRGSKIEQLLSSEILPSSHPFLEGQTNDNI